MEETKQETYGTATVGFGTGKEREIPIIEYVSTNFPGNRLVSIMKLADDQGYMIGIENPESSGRNPSNNMWLGEESFHALLGGMMLYCMVKKIDHNTKLREMFGPKGEINYTTSPNITPSDFMKDNIT